MKRLAVTTFVLLYVALIFSLPAQRTTLWASQVGEVIVNPVSVQGSAVLHKAPRSDEHLSRTKLIEAQFVVESPRESTYAPPDYSEHHVARAILEYHTPAIDGLFLSRAPPSLI